MTIQICPLPTESLSAQNARWPATGRSIMASFDADSIVVYQAYNRPIGQAAIADQALRGGGFSLNRMSWIKPGFLWMMHRSGWATKPDQEVILAVRIDRALFDSVLAAAVHSSYVPAVYGERSDWQAAGRASDVRLQWDPDHAPNGAKRERRAIQLGLRGDLLRQYASQARSIVDMTPFVAAQRSRKDARDFEMPVERVYPVSDAAIRRKLGLSEA